MVKAGKEVPAIEKRPDIVAWGWIWQAFGELNTCRSFGGAAIGPIPWTAVAAYADTLDLSPWERELFFTAIRGMDAVWREMTNEEAKPE